MIEQNKVHLCPSLAELLITDRKREINAFDQFHRFGIYSVLGNVLQPQILAYDGILY